MLCGSAQRRDPAALLGLVMEGQNEEEGLEIKLSHPIDLERLKKGWSYSGEGM